jgi:hypothetical protein
MRSEEEIREALDTAIELEKEALDSLFAAYRKLGWYKGRQSALKFALGPPCRRSDDSR